MTTSRVVLSISVSTVKGVDVLVQVFVHVLDRLTSSDIIGQQSLTLLNVSIRFLSSEL